MANAMVEGFEKLALWCKEWDGAISMARMGGYYSAGNEVAFILSSRENDMSMSWIAPGWSSITTWLVTAG